MSANWTAGTPTSACLRCGHPVETAARFCGNCGASVVPAPPDPAAFGPPTYNNPPPAPGHATSADQMTPDYGTPVSHPYQPAPGVPPAWSPTAGDTRGNTLSIIAIVCGVVSLLFLPILFGPAGIVCAGVGLSRHERWAPAGMAGAVLGMIAGFVLGVIVWSM